MNTYYIVYEDWDRILQVYNTEDSYQSVRRAQAAEQVTKWNYGEPANFWIVNAHSVDEAERLAMRRRAEAHQAAERRAEEQEARRRLNETPKTAELENLFGRKGRPAKMQEARNKAAGSPGHPRRGRRLRKLAMAEPE